MSETDRVRVCDLPTLADRPRPNLAKPSTRVELKAAKDKSDDKAGEKFRRDVWTRDQNKCRRCGKVVTRSIELQPSQGHVHHIALRSKVKALLTDARNGILVCAICHQGLTHHEISIVGPVSATFALEGKRYLDATSLKLKFIKKEIA